MSPVVVSRTINVTSRLSGINMESVYGLSRSVEVLM
jgi:hypothetical protein